LTAGGYIVAHSHFNPDGDNVYNMGDNTNAWNTITAYNYVDKCLYLDSEDDLEIIKNMKPLTDEKGEVVLDEASGKPKLDNSSLPDWIQVPSGIEGDNPFRNLGHTVDLLLGAIRKLTARIEQLENK